MGNIFAQSAANPVEPDFRTNLAMSNTLPNQFNVLGEDLQHCSSDPLTGWYRNGFCQTDEADRGTHVVCAQVTDEFLQFSKSRGNDLTQPVGKNFPGLKDGDSWCLCAMRWREAGNLAPPVNIHATEQNALKFIDLEWLKENSLQ